MAFGLDAGGDARGRERASTDPNSGESRRRSKVTFRQETGERKKVLPLLHKKTGQKSTPFTVSSLFAGSDTCRIRDSAGAGEQGAVRRVTSRQQST